MLITVTIRARRERKRKESRQIRSRARYSEIYFQINKEELSHFSLSKVRKNRKRQITANVYVFLYL